MGDGEELEADVCVVGSGAAGTTLALDLRARGRSVLVLESGGGVRDPETDDLLDLETEALPVGRESRQRALGGTTNVWWGASATLDDVEFAPRPWLGVPSWPLDRSDLLPYYERACRLIGVPNLTTTGHERIRKGNGFLLCTDDLDTVSIFWPKRPLRFGRLLQADVGTTGIDAWLFANVTRLVVGDGGTRVDRLEVRTITGRRFWVRARTVVLACGGIENPRLLLASTGGRGLGDGGAATGRYYMDHPKGVVGRVRVDPRARRLPHPAYWDSRPGRFRLGIRLSPAR